MATVKRPDSELPPHLEEQIGFLLASMDAYDAGTVSEAKRIAASLRILLHDRGQSSVSLLSQLGLKRCDFFDTAGDLIPKNLLSESRLTYIEQSAAAATFRPRCAAKYYRRPGWRRFDRWWTAAVIKTNSGELFSRADLVLSMADQDGGAHIDPAIEEGYHRLTRGNAMAWVFTDADGSKIEMDGPEGASVRQIAEEVVMTLQKWAVGCLPEPRRLPRAERRRA